MLRVRRGCALLVAVVLAGGLVPSAFGITLESGLLRVHIADGGEDLAQATRVILENALAEFEDSLPAGDAPIDVYICQTLEEFRRLGAPGLHRAVEGFADSSAGVIVIRGPKLLRGDLGYNGVLRHELLHLLIARNTAEGNVPRWLNEGLAMMLSREHRWSSSFRVARMYWRGRIIPYRALGLAFSGPRDDEEFGDAYAQSLSMTKYLRRTLGEDGFWNLIRSLRVDPFPIALQELSGMTRPDFFQAWRDSLWTIALVSSLVSGFGIFPFGAVLVVIAYVRKRRRGRKVLEAWAEDEDEDDDIIFPWQLEDQDGPYEWEDDSDD